MQVKAVRLDESWSFCLLEMSLVKLAQNKKP